MVRGCDTAPSEGAVSFTFHTGIMPVVYDPVCLGHHMSWSFHTGNSVYRVNDSGQRAVEIRNALQNAAGFEFINPDAVDSTRVATMHPYHDFIRETAEALPAQSKGAFPFMFPGEGAHIDQKRNNMHWMGRFCSDFYTPIMPDTYRTAFAAAACALTAADRVSDGTPYAYALCRPSGHHAGPRNFGGYCYFNNAALAAEKLAQHGRVAIVDIDYHHGNGTQEFFYHRKDVFFASLHADPAFEYPYFWGYSDEIGHGDGQGATLNAPLPEGTTEVKFIEALDQIIKAVSHFEPRYLVVSLGVDGHSADPLSTFRLGPSAFDQSGARLGALGVPTVICQEGGYCIDCLGELTARFLSAFRCHHDATLANVRQIG